MTSFGSLTAKKLKLANTGGEDFSLDVDSDNLKIKKGTGVTVLETTADNKCR